MIDVFMKFFYMTFGIGFGIFCTCLLLSVFDMFYRFSEFLYNRIVRRLNIRCMPGNVKDRVRSYR